jgi:hypothetical protein
MFCSECGQKNQDDAKFCVKCGKKLTAVEALSSPSPEPEKPPEPVFQDSIQARATSNDSVAHVSTELKDSGTVTAMSVIGFVFGLIGMLGSFIPCIGALAFYIGIPAAIISAIGLGIAYSQNTKKTFAIVAVTISLIGVVISGWQFFSIISAGKNAEREIKKMLNQEQQNASNNNYTTEQKQNISNNNYTTSGIIKVADRQGNNYLKLTLLSSENNNIFVWCSGEKTRIYESNNESNWNELTLERKIEVSGNWIEQEGEKLLWANRIDLL